MIEIKIGQVGDRIHYKHKQVFSEKFEEYQGIIDEVEVSSCTREHITIKYEVLTSKGGTKYIHSLSTDDKEYCEIISIKNPNPKKKGK